MLHNTNGANVDGSGKSLSKTVDGHFPNKNAVITVITTPSHTAPKQTKPRSSNTADMQQSTNVHDVHLGTLILPKGTA